MVFEFLNPRETAIVGDKFNPKLVLDTGQEISCTTLCGKRPYVVVSSNDMNDNNWNCYVVPLRSLENANGKSSPEHAHVKLSSGGFMEGYADVESLTSIGQNELNSRKFLCCLSEADMRKIERAIIVKLLGNTDPKTLAQHVFISDIDQTKQELLTYYEQPGKQKPSSIKARK